VAEQACGNHPGEITGLSCGACGDPVCVDCVRHLQIGTRCLRCAGETAGSAAPAAAGPSFGVSVSLLTVAALLSPLLVSLVGFILVNIDLARRPLPRAWMFRLSGLALAGLVVAAAGAFTGARDINDVHLSAAAAVVLAAAGVTIAVACVWGLARCYRVMREQERARLAAGSIAVCVATIVWTMNAAVVALIAGF